jgi:osmotically-inducible protein OsmY
MLRQIPIAIPVLLAAACAAERPEDANARAQAISNAVAAAEARDSADERIENAIGDALFRYDLALFAAVAVSVERGRTTLSGQLRDRYARAEALRLAWSVEGVTGVDNRLTVAVGPGLDGAARDGWIRGEMQRALQLDPEVAAENFTVEAVDERLSLMGLARNRDELERVLAHARGIAYVRGIDNSIRLAGRRG